MKPLSKLSVKQIDRLSEIYMGVGHISLASIILPAVIDKFNAVLVILGVVIMFAGWFASMFILRTKNAN